MSEEEKEKELSKLQKKLGELQTSFDSFKKKSNEKLEGIKIKLSAANEKRKEMLESLTDYYEALKERFSRKGGKFREDVRSIICYECGGQIGYMRGYVEHLGDFYHVLGAEFIDYSPNSDPVVIGHIGEAMVSDRAVIMWF